MTSRQQFIEGIECRLARRESVRTVQRVLEQIGSRKPKDFDRLRDRVRKIVPLSRSMAEDGTLGFCQPLDFAKAGDPSTWRYQLEPPVVVHLLEKQKHLTATAAHEFGHACERPDDLFRRGQVPLDEWRSELTADWYAYRWGFGRLIAAWRKTRAWSHHGVAPGEEFTFESGGMVFRFRVTRNFVVHLDGD